MEDVVAEGARPPGSWMVPSTFLLVAGIVLVFVAFLQAAVWGVPYAMYFLVGGMLLLIVGFVLASRSR